MSSGPASLISARRDQAIEVVESLDIQVIAAIADILTAALRRGNTIFTFGNGGSGAQAQHFAAELVGRFALERDPLPALALTTDTSTLTAIGNDFGFERVFSRQIFALGRDGDVAVGLSTSGRSPNVLDGLAAASAKQMRLVLLTGRDTPGFPGATVFRAASVVTSRIQEAHLVVCHILCELIELGLRRQIE